MIATSLDAFVEEERDGGTGVRAQHHLLGQAETTRTERADGSSLIGGGASFDRDNHSLCPGAIAMEDASKVCQEKKTYSVLIGRAFRRIQKYRLS